MTDDHLTLDRLDERMTGHEKTCEARWSLLKTIGTLAMAALLSILGWFNIQVTELKTLSEVRDQRIQHLQGNVAEIKTDVKRLLDTTEKKP